jgi:hypothetical protein
MMLGRGRAADRGCAGYEVCCFFEPLSLNTSKSPTALSAGVALAATVHFTSFRPARFAA